VPPDMRDITPETPISTLTSAVEEARLFVASDTTTWKVYTVLASSVYGVTLKMRGSTEDEDIPEIS
jgi:hypothetical protein